MHTLEETTIKLLEAQKRGVSTSAFSARQIDDAKDVLTRLNNLYKNILKCFHIHQVALRDLAEMYGRSEAVMQTWHAHALNDYVKKLSKAGIISVRTTRPAPRERKMRVKTAAVFPCPNCKAKVKMPGGRRITTQCGSCRCEMRIACDKATGITIEIINAKAAPARDDERPLTLAECYELLEVSPASPLDVVKKAYYSQIQQYHPDKVYALGPALKEVAEKMSKRLNQAWSMIRGNVKMSP